jgi:hypothetical protein
VLQLVGNLGKHRLLRRRQLQHNRHQQPLALHLLRRTLLQHALKQHALVRHMLIDNPQSHLHSPRG